eukprot:Seg2443.1 transcript_id=Seg2443.1/GoldUCD/mRNA.D3Y31 product="Beta-1 adrenergic receptor" protein_id=Seg2443.1/GoldUCD/D3Y31
MATANTSDFAARPFCMTLISFDLPRNHQVALTTAYILLAIVTMLSNAVLMYTLFKTKQLNTISSKLIIVMSISDLCMGAIALPIIAFRFMKIKVLKGCALDKASAYITLYLAFFSFLMLYCISVDRYFKVMKMTRYNLYMNDLRMKLMIITSIVVAAIIPFVSLMYPSFSQQVVAALVGSFLVTLAIILYVPLLRRLRNHRKQFNELKRIGPNNHADSANGGTETFNSTTEGTNAMALNRPTENWNSQLSAIKTMQILLIFLIVTYAPYHFISCWWMYYKFHKKTDPDLHVTLIYAWSIFVSLSNAGGNSWIIIVGNKRSRKFVSSLLQRNRTVNVTEN